ncbi:MAG: nuclear transport factor 2 family protein [Cyanothece sp. SIO2G6]|nr:nuclear transport factor 2 family protein [Cyanothece sp. SIO2G6]
MPNSESAVFPQPESLGEPTTREIQDQEARSSIGAAHHVVEAMYDAINRRDLEAAMVYIDPDCVYQDLNFARPFVGKAAVRQLFNEFCQGLPDDLQLVIDDITCGDGPTVGILWHVELAGIPFPNGRGASFYRLSDQTGQIVLARDAVEPPLKLGHVAFWIIRLVTPLVRRFLTPTDATTSATNDGTESAAPRLFPWAALLLWAIAIFYTYILILSPPGQWLPGEPIWAIQPETIHEVVAESTNFWFILPILNHLGIHFIEAPVIHPITEALFNLAEAWIAMFLPLLLLDRRGQGLPKVSIWGGALFLTNVFFTPYMALRASNPQVQDDQPPQKTLLARMFALVGLGVGTGAIAWGLFARPEFGDWMARSQYLLMQLTTNRVAIAFGVDLVFFAVFQIILMGAIEPQNSRKRWLRFIPLWGLGVWLLI